MINPNFKAKVSLRVIESTLRDLLYVSIDQRLYMVEHDVDSTVQQRRFLEQCLEKKEAFVQLVLAELRGAENDTHVDHAKFLQVITPVFARPCNLRQFVLYKTKAGELSPEALQTT